MPDITILKEEIFGLAVTISKFKEEEEKEVIMAAKHMV